MRRLVIGLAAGLAVLAGTALAQSRPIPKPVSLLAREDALSPRPRARPGPAFVTQVSIANSGFARWIDDFRRRARAEGIPSRVLDVSFAGIRYNTEVIGRDRHQAEFSKPIWEYLDGAVSQTRIRTGREMLVRHESTLRGIEARYGVDRHVVVAIWGLESAFGSYRGNTDIVEALATLAYDGRRGDFFEEQLLAALKIIADGDVHPRKMTGSWAGAMGHTQFIPTSYLSYAVDHTGDGRRDIWADDPADALASTAAYLSRHGWATDRPWGVEVRLPQDFDFSRSGRDTVESTAFWARKGVRTASGAPLPRERRASILLPAGARGPALMVFDNFGVIERYNTADSYVIAVGHLSDRLRGAGPFAAEWPRGDRPLRRAEKMELQKRLTASGFSTDGVDGRIGPNTIDAIRRYQLAAGLTPDGYASADLLQNLR